MYTIIFGLSKVVIVWYPINENEISSPTLAKIVNSPNALEVVPISPQIIFTPKRGVCDSLSTRIPEISSDWAFRRIKNNTLKRHNFFIFLKFLRWNYPDQVHESALSCMVLVQTAPQ